MKIALLQDQLLTPAGSERMFLYMAEEFREADLFTIAYNPKTTLPEFRGLPIQTHWIGRFIMNHKTFKSFFPLLTYAFQFWDFRQYDIILSSSATIAKYISRFKGCHICYCYFPTRAIWDTDHYFDSKGIKETLFRLLLPYFKRRDLAAATRVSHFIGISKTSSNAIKDIYHRDSYTLFCPIDYERFSAGLNETKRSHYLIVSRLEHWKMLDYAIEAFNNSGLPLKIIGKGDDEARLKAMSLDNICYIGTVDDNTLVKEYGKARAVIFTPELEYGLVPLEACASGTPVIALGRGGVKETMIPHKNGAPQNSTAIFYEKPTAKALNEAIETFESLTFDRQKLNRHAAQFNIPNFKKQMRSIVSECI